MKRVISLWVLSLVMLVGLQIQAAEPMKALIVEGQNNHGVWPKTTKMMKRYLEETKSVSNTHLTLPTTPYV